MIIDRLKMKPLYGDKKLKAGCSRSCPRYLSAKTGELRDEGVAQQIFGVKTFLGKTPDSDSQRSDLLLERRLPTQVAIPILRTKKREVIESHREHTKNRGPDNTRNVNNSYK